MLNGADAQTVIGNLNDLRKILTTKENLAAYVTADWAQLKAVTSDLEGPWLDIVNSKEKNEHVEKRYRCVKSF